MRTAFSLLMVVLVSCLAACPASTSNGTNPFGDDGAIGEPSRACQRDADCVTAAESCCACPTFAVNRDDPTQGACVGVDCPVMPGGGCPDNVHAACEAGQCVLACAPVACPDSCEAGFALDAAGCLSCGCAAPLDGGCMRDTDCVETRAACCGCAEGGEDTAVLAGDQAAFDASLGCGPTPTCPQVDVCEPGAAPACVQGRCELTTAGGLPPGACGRSDLPPCPSGTTCTVNANPQATAQGVGVCVQP